MQRPGAYRHTQRTGIDSEQLSSLSYESGSAAADPGQNTALDALDLSGRLPHTSREIRRRIRAALGSDPNPAVAQHLESLYRAALSAAGAGYSTHCRGARSAEQIILRILGRR